VVVVVVVVVGCVAGDGRRWLVIALRLEGPAGERLPAGLVPG